MTDPFSVEPQAANAATAATYDSPSSVESFENDRARDNALLDGTRNRISIETQAEERIMAMLKGGCTMSTEAETNEVDFQEGHSRISSTLRTRFANTSKEFFQRSHMYHYHTHHHHTHVHHHHHYHSRLVENHNYNHQGQAGPRPPSPTPLLREMPAASRESPDDEIGPNEANSGYDDSDLPTKKSRPVMSTSADPANDDNDSPKAAADEIPKDKLLETLLKTPPGGLLHEEAESEPEASPDSCVEESEELADAEKNNADEASAAARIKFRRTE